MLRRGLITTRDKRETATLTPDFVGVDFTVEIEVGLDEDLADRLPLKLLVREPDRLQENSIGNDDDQQEHGEIQHLNHLRHHDNTQSHLLHRNGPEDDKISGAMQQRVPNKNL